MSSACDSACYSVSFLNEWTLSAHTTAFGVTNGVSGGFLRDTGIDEDFSDIGRLSEGSHWNLGNGFGDFLVIRDGPPVLAEDLGDFGKGRVKGNDKRNPIVSLVSVGWVRCKKVISVESFSFIDAVLNIL